MRILFLIFGPTILIALILYGGTIFHSTAFQAGVGAFVGSMIGCVIVLYILGLTRGN